MSRVASRGGSSRSGSPRTPDAFSRA